MSSSSKPTAPDDNYPARVPYVYPEPGTDPVADSIRARRPNGILRPLDGVLLQSHDLAASWNTLVGNVRHKSSLSPAMTELFVLRVGALNNAAYCWLKHEPVARAADLTIENLREIRTTPAFGLDTNSSESSLTPELQAAMRLADAMTKDIKVPQDVFDGLRKFLNEQQMVDAVGAVATYNLVSRFVVALDVDGKMDADVPIPS